MTTFTTQDREDAERKPMNANEIADALDKASEYLRMIGDADFKKAATMLRQQQAEIEELFQFIVERGETSQLIMWKAQEK